MLAEFIRWTAQQGPKGVLLIDFDGVGAASASFLRESVLAFRDYARGYQPEVFPVVANLNDEIREEFALLLRSRGEAILCCRVDDAGQIVDVQVLGALDSSLERTLDAIKERGAVSLAELRSLPDDAKASTWSNRLASLIRQGFVVPSPNQKRRQYRFVLADVGGTGGS
jgi:hypothetical protein